MEMELDHFSHPHRLLLLKNNTTRRGSDDYYYCKACSLPISGGSQYYGCEKCNQRFDFKIHISCAKLPRMMENHPFHPQHTLTLLAESPYNKCYVCGFHRPYEVFSFACLECKFVMDIRCSAMMPIKSSGSRILLKNSRHPHPHPLLICDSNTSFALTCRCCWQPIIAEDPVLVCFECPASMHESCTEFPQEMQHIFHPQHPLILTPAVDDISTQRVCDACGTEIRGFFFHCEQCDFVLEISCASLTPTTSTTEEDVGDEDHHHVTTHPHPMIECYKKRQSLRPLNCSGCMEHFKEKESIYACLRCKQLLHKSCARSPRQIMDHPFHPAHPLTLFDGMPSKLKSMLLRCNACMIKSSKVTCHFYICRKCNFHLHTKCALSVAPFINLVLHQHPVAFVDIKNCLSCSVCGRRCLYPFFRCMVCDYVIHVHCLSVLPPIVKHKCHLHPLTLNHSPVKDHEDEDEDAEFYCDVCEKYRLLHEPTYYCVECHYVAHVHCVISEVFPYLEREFASLSNKLGRMKLGIALDVVEDIAGPQLQKDAHEGKMEVLEGAFIGAGILEDDLVTTRADDSPSAAVKELVDTASEALLAELDAEIVEQTTKLDQLKKRRAQYVLSIQK